MPVTRARGVLLGGVDDMCLQLVVVQVGYNTNLPGRKEELTEHLRRVSEADSPGGLNNVEGSRE